MKIWWEIQNSVHYIQVLSSCSPNMRQGWICMHVSMLISRTTPHNEINDDFQQPIILHKGEVNDGESLPGFVELLFLSPVDNNVHKIYNCVLLFSQELFPWWRDLTNKCIEWVGDEWCNQICVCQHTIYVSIASIFLEAMIAFHNHF